MGASTPFQSTLKKLDVVFKSWSALILFKLFYCDWATFPADGGQKRTVSPTSNQLLDQIMIFLILHQLSLLYYKLSVFC